MGTRSCQEGGDGDSFGALSSCCRRRGKGQEDDKMARKKSRIQPLGISLGAIGIAWFCVIVAK